MKEPILGKTVIIGIILLIFLVSSVHGEPDSFGIARNITFQESLSSKYPIWGGSGRFSTVDSGGVGVSSSVALDKNGYTRISYADTANGHLKYAWQNTSGWNNYSLWYNATIDSSDNVGRGTSLEQDSNGFSHISYLDSANHALKYARQNESGWQITLLESGGIGGIQTSLALDNADYPHICYFNDTSRHLKYTWQNGSGWWNTTLDGTGTAEDYASLALDNGSHAHISYYDSVNGDLKYTWEDDLGWHRSTIDSEGDVGNYSSLALDSSGYAHVSYLDATNGHLKYALQNSSGWFNSTVYSGPGAGGYSSLVIDSEGNAHFSCSGGLHESALYGTEYDGEFHFFPIGLLFGYDSMNGSYTSLALDSEGYYHISYAHGSIPVLRYFYGRFGPIPVLNFTTNVTSGRAPLTIQFNDTSIGPVTQWGWDFGDGNYSTEQNPVHTYTFPGHFLMEHSVSSRDGTGLARRYIDVFSVSATNFTGTPTSGIAPLTVTFTDLSSNNPTGWAWYFGDENYAEPWTQMTASAGWSGRLGQTSVPMPDGSIVLMGGSQRNDVWRSTDEGATWVQVNASAGWLGRSRHSSVVMPDGSIVLTGGFVEGTGAKNDVWRSTDDGATWTQMTANAGWPIRSRHCSVAMPDGSIVLMGGEGGGPFGMNDVWRSTDDGATWTQMTANAGWSARSDQACVAMADSSIVLIGGIDNSGNYKNDVWRSTDDGATWTQMTGNASWIGRWGHSSVVLPDGGIVLMGGIHYIDYKNDVWRSKDYGATWTEINRSAGWSARGHFNSVVMPDGSIVLMGGMSSGGTSVLYDVWRFAPTGSSAQNPSHSYTTPGTYQVTLQAYNAGGYDSTRKAHYILVDNEGTDSGGDLSPPITPNPTTPSLGKTITETVNVGGGSAVSRAEINGTNLGKNLVVTAFPRNNLPSGIALTQTTVYQYLSIVSSTIPGVVEQATLEFSVPQAWLTEHGFTAGDIVMMHYDNGQWQELDTRYVSQNSGNVFYRTTTPGFSYFAIVYQKDGTDMGTEPPVPTMVPTQVTVLKAPVQEAPSPIEITREKTPAVPPSQATQPSGGIPMTTIIVGTTGAIATVIGTVFIRRWWIRKQNPTLFRKNDRY